MQANSDHEANPHCMHVVSPQETHLELVASIVLGPRSRKFICILSTHPHILISHSPHILTSPTLHTSSLSTYPHTPHILTPSHSTHSPTFTLHTPSLHTLTSSPSTPTLNTHSYPHPLTLNTSSHLHILYNPPTLPLSRSTRLYNNK